jgi:hypothetical protein
MLRESAAVALLGACLCSQAGAQPPPGWRILKSVSQPPARLTPGAKCTLAVPANWLNDNTLDRAQAHSPDGRSRAFVQEWPSKPKYPTFLNRKNQTLIDYRKKKADSYRVYHQDVIELKVLEDSATRLELLRVNTEPLGSGVTDWTLWAAGDPICYAMVSVQGTAPTVPPAEQEAARERLAAAEKIVATFTPAR